MKKRNRVKIIAAGAMAILLCVLAAMPVSAMTPPVPSYGSVPGGVFVVDGGTELALEKSELVFDISELLRDEYKTVEDFLAYGGQVTATYTVYNPTDHAVTERLAAPMGNPPTAARELDQQADAYKYAVEINGAQVQTQTRHAFTVDRYYYANNLQYSQVHDPSFGLAYLSDTYALHTVLVPDAPVYVYSYLAAADPDSKENGFEVSVSVEADPENCKVFATGLVYPVDADGHKLTLYGHMNKSDSFTICSVGEDVGEAVCRAEYYTGETAAASVTLMGRERMTFYEFVMRGYDPEIGVSEIDCYNAFIAYEEKYCNDITVLPDDTKIPPNYFQPWQVFDLTLAPGESTTVTVRAPLYPFVHDYYKPAVYTYAFAMTQDDAWSACGQTSVRVITDHYLYYEGSISPIPSMNAYTETEQGYLWEGQADFPYLIVSTCEEQKPFDHSIWVGFLYLFVMLVVVFVVYILPPALLLGGIVLTVFLIVRRRKKKKGKATEQTTE